MPEEGAIADGKARPASLRRIAANLGGIFVQPLAKRYEVCYNRYSEGMIFSVKG